MCLSLYLFYKVSLLAILVDKKSKDAPMKFFYFSSRQTVYVQEMSISLYF
jgi:hypothetical protein